MMKRTQEGNRIEGLWAHVIDQPWSTDLKPAGDSQSMATELLQS
ncbi:MAG: hypothetical protein P8L18_03095 [Verrucomicrobiota bacterium]|nr:hypothetical protein [Verrucomicrobiota bacterium]